MNRSVPTIADRRSIRRMSCLMYTYYAPGKLDIACSKRISSSRWSRIMKEEGREERKKPCTRYRRTKVQGRSDRCKSVPLSHCPKRRCGLTLFTLVFSISTLSKLLKSILFDSLHSYALFILSCLVDHTLY